MPFLRQFFSEESEARTWLDDAREDAGLAPMVGTYDRMVAEYRSRQAPRGST